MGAEVRSLLVILIFFALAEPAAACRRFSIWHYNFPQPPCPIASPKAQAAPAPAAPDIPLPGLTEIIWGENGDGRLVAIGKLRVLATAAKASLAAVTVSDLSERRCSTGG